MRQNKNFSFLAFLLSVALSAVQILPVYGFDQPVEPNPPEAIVEEQGPSDDVSQAPVNTDPSSDSSSPQDESQNPDTENQDNPEPSLPGTDQDSNEETPSPSKTETPGDNQAPENDLSPRTLSAQSDALKLSVTGVFNALPDAVTMKIEAIPHNAENEKKLTSSLFANDEKVSLYGYRITWISQDGTEVTPDDPHFTLDFDLAKAGISKDAVTSSILQEKDGSLIVISDESSGLSQTSQTLHSEFDAADLETLYVATIQKQDQTTPSSAAAAQKVTADTPEKSEPKADPESDEPITDEQTVYCYTVVPGVKITPDGNCNSEWNGMGIGLVSGVPEAHYVSSTSANYLNQPGVNLIKPAQLPDIDPNSQYPDSYPPITATSGKSGETKVYQYAAPGSGKEHTYGYYTIDWDQLLMSNGANAGKNGYNPTMSYFEPTWHLNGVIYLNQKEYVSVGFYLKEAGSDNWTNLSALRTTTGTTEKAIYDAGDVPKLDDSQYPEYKTVNGIIYHLVFWSDDQNMSDPHSLDQNVPIDQNKAFYAAYIPEPSKILTISKKVDGEFADDSQAFSFRIRMSWKNEAYQPSAADIEKYGLQGSDGTYTFSLKAGETMSLQIPEAATVTVEELLPENSGYVSKVSNNGQAEETALGPIDLNEDTSLVFTNTRQSWAVRFKFRGFDQKEFKELSSVTVPADTATGSWLAEHKDVPTLADYPQTVVQNGQIYRLTSWSTDTALAGAQAISKYGQLSNGETFYAGYIPLADHLLTVRKTVSGAGANPDQDYRFIASLSYNNEPFEMNESQLEASGWKQISRGEYEFTLKANEQSSLRLPDGVHVQIDEQNEADKGFISTILADGKEQQDPYEADLLKDTLVEYHNEKQQWNIEFKFRHAGSTEYELLRAVSVPAATTTEEDLYKKSLVPDLDDCPAKTISNGIAYRLVYWSDNQSLNPITSLHSDTLVKDHEVFYAGYLPVESKKLSITKDVTGDVTDPDRSYDFTVKLSWEGIPYTLSDSQLQETGWKKTDDGVYKFSLKNKETARISLPEGTKVVLDEADESKAGFKTTVLMNGQKAAEPVVGQLSQDTDILFTNEKQEWKVSFYFRDAGSHDWTLINSVNVPADTSTEQTLLKDNLVPDLSKYPQTKVVNGMIYHLKAWSESKDLTDLTDFNNANPLSQDENFYAGYVADEEKTLSITKQVAGQNFDTARAYSFTISLGYQGKPFELSASELKQAGWTEKEKGTYTLTLKENETSTAFLPAGITWSVEEADYKSLGFVSSVSAGGKSSTGRVLEGTLTDNATAQFTNTKQQWTVDFKFRNPDEPWSEMKQATVPAETSTLKTLEDLDDVPSLEGKAKVLVKDGIVYDLKTWSETESLSDPVDFNDDLPLKDKETFYAGYVPRTTYPPTVEKTVRGEGANPDHEYSFRIKLLLGCNAYDPNADLVKAAGWTKVADGEYTVSLKSDESSSIDLPEGVQVSIDEDDYSNDGFLSMINVNGEEQTDPWTGTINTETNVKYINIKQQWYVSFRFQNVDQTGWTTLKKVSVPADTTMESSLITNHQVPDLSAYPETVVSDGEIYHRITWSNSPDLSDPHNLDQNIPLQDGEVFYGGYKPETTVSLAIRKIVEGNGADPQRKYHFTVELSYENQPFDLSESQMKAAGVTRQKAGIYTIDLLNEERSTLQVPKGIHVSVNESEESSEGFETSLEVNKAAQDVPYSDVLSSDTELDFINRKKQWTVEFMFKDAGESSFTKLSTVSVPADTSTEETLAQTGNVPSLENHPENVIKNGKAWHLVYWSGNTDLNNPGTLDNDTPLKDHEIFYGGYIPIPEKQITIKKTVEGDVTDPDRLYDFDIDLTWASQPFDPAEVALTEAGWTKTDTGHYKLSLKNGETSSISLPVSTSITVTEADYSKEGFTTALKVNNQSAQAPFDNELTDDTDLEFINEKQDWTVSFYFKDAGSKTFDLMKTADVPAATSTEQTLHQMNLIPDLSGYPEAKAANGMIYHLRFWSKNSDLRNLSDLDSTEPLTDHEDFYAGYVPEGLKSLTISKTVDGRHLDENRKFSFTISLEDQGQPFDLSESELKEAGWTKTAAGTYTVPLEENQSSTAMLPEDITWTVVEDDYSDLGYKTTAIVNDIPTQTLQHKHILSDNSTIEVTNIKEQWEIGFMFREPGSSTWTLMKDADVPADTSTLKTLLDDKDVPDLSTKPKIVVQDGTIYQLKTWSESEDLNTEVDFDSDQKLKDDAVFYAGYVPIPDYTLSFEKTVNGFDDTQRDFSFNVVFTYKGVPFEPSKALIESAGLTRQTDGAYSFTAKAGNSISFKGLPEGVVARIFESDYAADGYQTSIEKDGVKIPGREVSVLMNKDSEVKFINTRKAWTIRFMLKGAADSEYSLLDSIEIPAESTVEDALVKAKDVPSLIKYPLSVAKDGKIWNLRFWSTHKNMSDAGSLDSDNPLYNGETFYAAYVPEEMETLTISKNVVSVIPDDQAEFEFKLKLAWKNKPFELGADSVKQFGLTETDKGIYSFKLKDTEQISDLPIPHGVDYQIAEVSTDKKLYSTSYLIKGKEESGTDTGIRTLDSNQRVSFINWEKTIEVDFYLKNAATTDFRKIDSVTLPGQDYTEDDLIERGLVPALSGLPEYQVIDGKVYKIHFWSRNAEMTDMTNLDTNHLVHDHEKLYAAYLPLKFTTLSVTNTVEGNDVNNDEKFSYVIRLSRDGKPFTECLTPLCNVEDTDYKIFDDLEQMNAKYNLKKQRHADPDNPWGLKNKYDGVEVHNNGDGTYTFTLMNGQEAGPFILPDDMDFEVEEINGFTDGFGTSYQIHEDKVCSKWIPKDTVGPGDLQSETLIHFLNVRNKEKPTEPSKPDENKDQKADLNKPSQTGNQVSHSSSQNEKPKETNAEKARSSNTGISSGFFLFALIGLLALLLIGQLGFKRFKHKE